MTTLPKPQYTFDGEEFASTTVAEAATTNGTYLFPVEGGQFTRRGVDTAYQVVEIHQYAAGGYRITIRCLGGLPLDIPLPGDTELWMVPAAEYARFEKNV